ncbi:MAG: hypothetical protein WA830_13425, partial [Candidatus Sulfotelmatobacter sp.]
MALLVYLARFILALVEPRDAKVLLRLGWGLGLLLQVRKTVLSVSLAVLAAATAVCPSIAAQDTVQPQSSNQEPPDWV